MIQKKSHARVLATVAEGTRDEGLSVGQMIPLIKMDYNKDVTPEMLEAILSCRELSGLVTQVGGTDRWVCTQEGLKNYALIQKESPDLLEKTTSSNIKMYA